MRCLTTLQGWTTKTHAVLCMNQIGHAWVGHVIWQDAKLAANSPQNTGEINVLARRGRKLGVLGKLGKLGESVFQERIKPLFSPGFPRFSTPRFPFCIIPKTENSELKILEFFSEAL